MRWKTAALVCLQMGVTALISVTAVRVMAQDGRPVDSAAATASMAFTFQGRLADGGGLPVQGLCDLQFTLWDAATGGVSVAGPLARNGVPVQNGYFSVPLDFGTGPFQGDARWVAISAGCGAPIAPIPGRTELTAAPYALSLRPGATILGHAAGSALTVGNSSGTALTIGQASIDGVRVVAPGNHGVYVSDALDSGIRSTSSGGHGVEASTSNAGFYGGSFTNTNATGAGLYGRGGSGSAPDFVAGGSGSSDDGVITSDPAYTSSDLFFWSNDGIVLHLDRDNNEAGNVQVMNGQGAEVLNVGEQGDVRSISTGTGLPKVLARIKCANSGALIYSSDSLALDADLGVTIDEGPNAGECLLDIGFDVTGHYVAATAVTGGAQPRFVGVWPFATDPQQLWITVYDQNGARTNGDVFVVVY